MDSFFDEYIHLRQKARDVFEMRYKETIDPDKNRWELCSRVLARKDAQHLRHRSMLRSSTTVAVTDTLLHLGQFIFL